MILTALLFIGTIQASQPAAHAGALATAQTSKESSAKKVKTLAVRNNILVSKLQRKLRSREISVKEAWEKQKKTVIPAVEAGVHPDTLTTYQSTPGYTPLECTIDHNDHSCARLFLQHGASLDTWGICGASLFRKVHNPAMADVLYESPQAKDIIAQEGPALLHSCLTTPHYPGQQMVAWYIARGVDPNALSCNGDTFLQVIAVYRGTKEEVGFYRLSEERCNHYLSALIGTAEHLVQHGAFLWLTKKISVGCPLHGQPGHLSTITGGFNIPQIIRHRLFTQPSNFIAQLRKSLILASAEKHTAIQNHITSAMDVPRELAALIACYYYEPTYQNLEVMPYKETDAIAQATGLPRMYAELIACCNYEPSKPSL